MEVRSLLKRSPTFLTKNKCQNAILLGKTGKAFAKSPARDYLGILENYMIIAVDLACMLILLEEENYHYNESKKTAGEESVAISQVVNKYREQMNGSR
jgi:hypothetical protein